jgi:PhnB protein
VSSYKPRGFHSITPYLVATDARRLIEFMRQAFGAEVVDLTEGQDGRIMHAALQIGDSMVEVSDEKPPQWPALKCALHLYVEDIDAVYGSAIAAGARSISTPTDQFYGDREASIVDPSGNYWHVATRKEEVSIEEMERRMASMNPNQ